MQKKDTTQLIITVILAVVLIFVLKANLQKKKKPGPVQGLSKQSATSPRTLRDVLSAHQQNQGQGLYAKLSQESQNLEFSRDPFSKVAVPIEGQPTVLYLKGIMQDGENYMAIINDEVVAVGNNILGNTVVEILKDRVILNDGENNFELRILEE